MRYILEVLSYDGWHADVDEEGRALPPMSRKQALAIIRTAKAWQSENCRWGAKPNPLRLRIVNTPAKPNRKKRQEAKRRWVTDYMTDRAYGGSEEGGWWYDTGEPVAGSSCSFYNEDNARAEADRRDELAAECNKSRGSRGDIGSVICDYALRAFLEHGPPRAYPMQRPYYC